MADKMDALTNMIGDLFKQTIRKRCQRTPGATTIQMPDNVGVIHDIWVLPADPGLDFKDEFEFVRDFRKDDLGALEMPMVRRMPACFFMQFSLQPVDGSLMNDTHEIWLNTESKYGDDYKRSVYVHEAVHYRQQVAINWDDVNHVLSPQVIYADEFEAYRTQREFLKSIGSSHDLVNVGDDELKRMIACGYRDRAEMQCKAYAADRAQLALKG